MISSGGTPDLWRRHAGSVVTEYRPGTYIYNDRMQQKAGAADWDDCALTVLATVVSRPTATRAVIDAGCKTLSSDAPGPRGIWPRSSATRRHVLKGLSEEHGVIELAAPSDSPRIGERVRDHSQPCLRGIEPFRRRAPGRGRHGGRNGARRGARQGAVVPDLLVRLYDLPTLASEAKVAAAGIAIRRALPPEGHLVKRWVGRHFNEGWVSECGMALSHLPPTIWIAIRDNAILGFACHDATAKGFFGPTGVDEVERGKGIGETLLIATLRGMREAGYGYAIIGGAGPVAFYQRRLDAMLVPNSVPGIYGGMLKDPSIDG